MNPEGDRSPDPFGEALARYRKLPKPQTIDALIRGFESVLQGAAGNAVDFRVVLSDSLACVSADSTQFRAALLNLVVNAREAMADGGRLELSTGIIDVAADNEIAPRLVPGRYVGIAVSDDGCGIAPDLLEHVFEPFFSSKETGQTCGLGLSQVYGFATQSGGGVGIVTAFGEGTGVTIYLPLMARATDPADGVDGGEAAGKRTILLVEDDKHVRDSTFQAIELLGYRVVAESSGSDALARLYADADIDILFTDVVMPQGMSGVTLAREARALRPGLRILLASGHPRDAADSGRHLEGFAFLAKPYRLQELASALRALKGGGGGS
jgi:CheY-like chemotaxis protein